MRSSQGFRLAVAASSFLLVSCGTQVDASALGAAARGESSACKSAVTIPQVNDGLTASGLVSLTLTGDTRKAPARPHACSAGPAAYYSFDLPNVSIVYADTFGSTIDAVVGLLEGDCEEPRACGQAACGLATQSRVVRVLERGTHHLLVAGRGDRERGAFVLHLQATLVSEASSETPADLLAREIPYGDYELAGVIAAGSGGSFDCGDALARGVFSWWWYASCPSDSGQFSARTVGAVETLVRPALSWVDVDDATKVCDYVGFGTPRDVSVDVADEREAGLHVLKVGIAFSPHVPVDPAYVVTGTRR